MNNNKSFFASIGLLFTAAIWGFAFVVVKDSLEYIGSVYMVAIRFLIASVGMALLFWKRLKKIENFVAESQGLAVIKLANLICKKNQKVSDLVAPLRKYYSSGEINSKVADVAPILAQIKKDYADGNMFELDGISVEYKDWWFNIRCSNTEPLLRLIVEAEKKEDMEMHRDALLKIIRG